MNKNRENFIKYSNDLYFHHLLVDNNPYLKFYSPTISVHYTTIDAFYFIYLSKNQQVHILVTVQEIQLFEVLLEFHREFLHCLHELYDNDILM